MRKTLLAILFLSTTAHVAFAEQTVEKFTTEAGWKYDYISIPDATGWKLTFAFKSDDAFTGQKEFPLMSGGQLLALSGYEGMSAADKTAYYEDLQSNGAFYFNQDSYFAEIYIDEDEIDDVAPIISDSFNKVEFDQDAFDNMKTQTTGGFDDFNKSPNGQAMFLTATGLNKNSGITFHQGELSTEDFANSNIDDFQAWYDRIFTNGDIKISIAGNGDPEQLNQYVDQILSKFDPTAKATIIPEPKRNFPSKLVVLEQPGIDKAVLFIDFSLPAIKTNLEGDSANFLNSVLGGDEQSRLFGKVRDELRAAYAISSSLDYQFASDPIIEIAGEIDPELQEEGYKAIFDIIEELRTNGISEAEFDATKKQFLVYLEEMFKDENMASYVLTDWQLHPNGPDDFLTALEESKGETYEEVNSLIKGYWPETPKFFAVIVTPSKGDLPADCVIQSVEEIGSCDLN